jgi:bacterial/archaeal transporter family-2 protein
VKRRAVGVALAGAAGVAMAVQSRVNGELAVRLSDGIAAAVISFGTGLVLLAVVVPLVPASRRGVAAVRRALREGTLRWWHGLGGLFGALVVATQGLTVPVLGVAVFAVALVAGQTASSLAVDRSGLPPGAVEPVTRARLLGAALCMVAVVVAVADRLGTPRSLALALLPLAAGAGIAWQQAVNGRVRAAAGSAWPATLVNFLAGTAALLVVFAVIVAVRGGPPGALPPEPWLYAGGLLGVAVIATAAAVVQVTGVLLLALSAIAGQLLGALALDLVVPADRPPAPNTFAGVALTLVAVAIASGYGRLAGREAAPAPAAAPVAGLKRRRRSGRGISWRSGRWPPPRC